MSAANKSTKRKRGITAADVGRFLRQMATAMRDPHTGNTEMSEALLNLSTILADAKYASVDVAAQKFMEQGGFDFDDGLDFSELTEDQIEQVLTGDTFTRAHLVILGTERFSIPRSRLEKLSRDEMVRLITAANQHEQSLSIIAEEARRGGIERSS